MLKKIFLLSCFIIQLCRAAYMSYDDTGTRYLTLSADAQYVYLWQSNGQLASQKFPYRLPDNTKLLKEPYFEDIDGDGALDIALVYQDNNTGKYYKLALRQNGELFDSRNWPQETNAPTAGTAPPDPLFAADFLTTDGRNGYDQRYNYYHGVYRHDLYDSVPPAAQSALTIYSQQPAYNLLLSSADPDFDRYVLLCRPNDRERYNFFAALTSPNTEITLTLNYAEGIYPWQLLTFDWLGNYTAQEILYYYDHTPPKYTAPENGREIYFSPNDDGTQDEAQIESTPTDNLYYEQTLLLDIFDGPTYITSVKRASWTFQKSAIIWNGRLENGQLCPDKTYQGIFSIADGCGNISPEVTLNIFLDTEKPRILAHNISHDYFTPNGDGELDVFSVTLNSSEPAQMVMQIYNAQGRRIKTLPTAGYQIDRVFVWDGLDNDGIIESGAYTYELLLTDRAGNTRISDRLNVFLDHKSPLVANVGPERAAYNFNYTGVTFNFDASEPLTAALYILDIAGEILATVNAGLPVPSGSHSLSWSGRLNDAVAPDGVYNYRLVARNNYGNTNAVSGVFYADSSLPPQPNNGAVTVNVYVQTANKPEPRYISANAEVKYSVNAGETALKYGISIMAVKNIGYITSKIMAEDGAEIAALTVNALIPAGSQEYRHRPASEPSGRYYFVTTIRDMQNNPAQIYSREEFLLDREPPTINSLRVFNALPGPCITTRNIDLEITATDNLLPITEIMFSLDGVTWNTPEAYTPLRPGYTQTPTDGRQTVYARVKDAAGNWSAAASVSVIVDTTPPRHLGLIVNEFWGGASGTINVSINFLAEDINGVQTMNISYNDAYSWVEYPYGVTLNYQLDPAAGAKNFYIKYTDRLGNASGIYQDLVYLDRAPPYDLQAQKQSPYYTNTRNVLFAISASDDDLGVDQIGFSNDDFQTETRLPYTPSENYSWTLSPGEGVKEIAVAAYDRANNRSNAVSLSYYYDITPPVIITENIKVETAYLPTLRDPLQILITANEPVRISLNVRRDGQPVYQTAQAETTSLNSAGYAAYQPAVNLGWSGQDNDRRYLRGGATYNIEYQILDRAGNAAGVSQNAVVYFSPGHELATANHDLIFPAIQATSANITVEYEDDPEYSVELISYSQRDGPDNGDREGERLSSRSFYLDFARSCFVDAYVTTLSNSSKGSGRFYISNFYSYDSINVTNVIKSGSRYGISTPVRFPAGTVDTLIGVDCENDSRMIVVMDISTKKIRLNRYNTGLQITDSYHGNYDNTDNKIRFEIYNNLNQNSQGTIGNLANAYTVTANNGNIYLSRNGVTINVTKYPANSGIETAEPSMYIVKNIGDRDLTGASEYNAMENTHIVWQQKNTPEDKWQIYYAVVPFLYEELPDGQFSIMSTPAPAPQTVKAETAPSGRKNFIEKVLNYPNPFAGETTLTYELAGPGQEVRARIYTLAGQLVRTLDDLPGQAGYNEYSYDGQDSYNRPLANDIYYLVILARDSNGKSIRARSKIVKLR